LHVAFIVLTLCFVILHQNKTFISKTFSVWISFVVISFIASIFSSIACFADYLKHRLGFFYRRLDIVKNELSETKRDYSTSSFQSKNYGHFDYDNQNEK
jgi:hypothetical protein